MINKQVANVKEALDGVANGMTLMLGGFGLCGIPENAISELVNMNVNNLTYEQQEAIDSIDKLNMLAY